MVCATIIHLSIGKNRTKIAEWSNLFMDNYLLEILSNTTDYIETNLLTDLNLDNISENVNLSKFHLLRIWKGATATGLMEYVRRRRIADSLGDLMNEKNTIEFISSKYSFGCERTYNRVFKDEFGTTPAKWRRNQVPLNILDRYNADFLHIAGDGLIFFRSVLVMPSLSLAGKEYKVNIEENMKHQIANKYGIDFFYNHRLNIVNPVNKDIYIGLTTLPEMPADYTYYFPSLQIDSSSIVPPTLDRRTIRPHKYGVFTYMGNHCPEDISSLTLRGIWDYIFGVWMPTIKQTISRPFHFEYIDYSRCNKQYCECDLYFPIAEV